MTIRSLVLQVMESFKVKNLKQQFYDQNFKFEYILSRNRGRVMSTEHFPLPVVKTFNDHDLYDTLGFKIPSEQCFKDQRSYFYSSGVLM